MATVRDFFEFINTFAPIETQEEWDNSGMLVGDMNAEVKKAVVVLEYVYVILHTNINFAVIYIAYI